jgi:CSLREA domain-containing protein
MSRMAPITLNPMSRAGLLIPLLGLLALLATAQPASAAFIAPNTFADDAVNNGNCTLREAIIAANTDQPRDACPAGSGNDGLLLGPGTYKLTIPPAGPLDPESGDLVVASSNPSRSLSIAALGRDTVIDANGLDRAITARTPLSINSVTLTGGDAGTESGGGLLLDPVAAGVSLTLRQVTVTGNSAGPLGGGIHAEGPLTVVRSTVSGNETTGAGPAEDPPLGGGGISATGPLRLSRSTVAGNVSAGPAGGVRYGGPFAIEGSLLADNLAAGSGNDCWTPGSAAVSAGFNLIESGSTAGCKLTTVPSDRPGRDPGLFSLADNGGPTPTHALPAGSAAADLGPAAGATGCADTSDQRGAPRSDSAGPRCDAGAYERAFCAGQLANLIGTGAGEWLVATAVPTSALGLGGDDVILGGPGNDALCGGPGTDVLVGGPGADVMVGGAGVDIVNYADAKGPVTVTLDGRPNDGELGEGDNAMTESVLGSRFADSLVGNGDRNGIVGGDGNDTIHGGGEADTLLGSGGADTIFGGPGNDIIDGGEGADTLNGEAGNDLIIGGAGNDRVDGGPGADRLRGGRGNDRIQGGDGNDTIEGGPGKDTLLGGPGNDLIISGPGKDRIRCGPGKDTVIATRRDKVARDCEKVRRR